MSTPTPTPFDRGAAEREAKAMFPNVALHRPAAQMAGCHPHALDYIRQAPVIVLAANAGRTGFQAESIAARASSVMRHHCERGARLREVMRFYSLPLPLRALYPNVLHPKRYGVIMRLGRVNASTLAQSIPAERSRQDTWLRALTIWSDHVGRRCGDHGVQFGWAVTALRMIARGQEGTVETVADLAVEAGRANPRPGAVFDPRWTFDQALAAAERWHAAMARRRAEVTAANGLNVGFTHAFDYAPFPNDPVVIDGFEFVPLRSCEDLYIEGAAMRHCVASYSRELASGTSRIFSVRRDGRRIATVEFGRHARGGFRVGVDRFADGTVMHAQATSWPSPRWSVLQVRGPCNAPPGFSVIDACTSFLRVALDGEAGDRGPSAAMPRSAAISWRAPA